MSSEPTGALWGAGLWLFPPIPSPDSGRACGVALKTFRIRTCWENQRLEKLLLLHLVMVSGINQRTRAGLWKSSLLGCSRTCFLQVLGGKVHPVFVSGPWKCSEPAWMGLGETWDHGRCPCTWQGVGVGGLQGSFQPFHGSVIPGADPAGKLLFVPIFTGPWMKVGGNLWRSPCPAPHRAPGGSQLWVLLGWSSTVSLGSLSLFSWQFPQEFLDFSLS